MQLRPVPAETACRAAAAGLRPQTLAAHPPGVPVGPGPFVIEIEIWGRMLCVPAQVHNFQPTLFGKEFFGPAGQFSVGEIALSAAQDSTTEQKEYEKSGSD